METFAAIVALVDQLDPDAGIQERQFAQALLQDLVLELEVREDRIAGFEPDRRAALVARTDHRQRRDRITETVLLAVFVSFPVDGQVQHFGKGVDDRHADAVQAARHLVRRVVEFATGVQDGEDHLGRGDPLPRMDIHRNSTAVVRHGDRLIGVDRDLDVRAVAGQRFVDRVVDDFENHVVEAGPVVGVADVHSRPLANGVKAF